jgi:coenzyme F420-reducing hydrogenase beta subunit
MSAIDRVIEGGFCIGCGSCAHLRPDTFAVGMDASGCMAARRLRPDAPQERDLSPLCPMTGEGLDETALAGELFADAPVDPQIGRHVLTGLGWVETGEFRMRGSSGGLLSWTACRLLELGEVDEVIHVAPTAPGTDALFAYRVSRSPADVMDGAKSRYYPIQAKGVLDHLRASQARAAFVGLPCFVKAMRLLLRDDPALAAKVPYILGLVCGHLKSARFAELLAWQKGIAPQDLSSIDFRDKIEGRRASAYGVRARASDGREIATPMADLIGKDWGQGMLKYHACEFCDDVLAECADLAVGDAWLPGWSDDWRGANVFVARHPRIVALIREAGETGDLRFEATNPATVARSQSSGLSHRREGLAWRLANARKAGRWVPRKRAALLPVAVGSARGLVYAARLRILRDSHTVFTQARQAGDLSIFIVGMGPALKQYAHAMAKRRPLRKRIWPMLAGGAWVRRILGLG